MIKIKFLRVFLLLATGAASHAQAPVQAPAALLNNRGVAQMSQQYTQRAADSFAEACKRDPHFAQAAINDGIALLALQKVDEAEVALRAALDLEPKNAQAWYVLGLVQHAKNQVELALQSFSQAIAADPHDADSLYYQGACYQELHQQEKAIAGFRAALAVNAQHASAEFGLARALQRTGNTAEAKTHFVRFQHLTNAKIASALGSAYGEQGHYATVLADAGGAVTQSRPTALHLEARAALDDAAHSKKIQLSATATGAACMIDATGGGQSDLILLTEGAQALRILHPQSGGRFTEVDAAAAGLKLQGRAVACAAGDYDGDALDDLAIALEDRIELYHNLGHGKFTSVTAASGMTMRNHPTGIGFVDYDHDGDLDLLLTGTPLVAGGSSNVLWRNNGNGTFTEQTVETTLGGYGRSAASILTDFNNDRAIDLVTTGDRGTLLYINPREGHYGVQPLYSDKLLPASRGIVVVDYDKDGWMDIAVTHDGAPGVTLWHNEAAADGVSRSFKRVELPLKDSLRGWGISAVDIDNDGWIDVAAIVETSAGKRLRILRNRGDGSFEDVSERAGIGKLALHEPRGLLVVDPGDENAPSLVVVEQNALPVVVRNTGPVTNHFVRLDLSGLADNKTALGAKVEVYAGGMWQKWEVTGSSGYGTQASPHLLVGLGQAKGIELLRILWPTGVLQDEIDLPEQRVLAVKEADRRGSSCPVLFVWDGSRYRFVTDVIGAGVVGHWFTPARRNTPNPGEWIKVEGEHVKLVDGKLSLRFMEPMEEVNYIDQLRLVAVDHPARVEVNPDERFLDEPPFASGRVVASQDLHLPVRATDGNGRDVTEVLSKRDHRFASGFHALPYDGFATLHALTLDLGEVKTDAPLRLLMTGYVNYFSATSLYGAWQAGIKPISSYVEAELGDGSWLRLAGDAGFPAGLERTIVVDLTGKMPAGAHRIRLMTNLQIYWDQVLIDQSGDAEARSTEVPLAFASLNYRGYPKQTEGASSGDLDYDYNTISLTGSFQHERGNYTRLGDVTLLVTGVDDHFAIFGSGEEIAAQFDTTMLPALPAGWKRDYFFYANGYVKDMDWWDSAPYTVAQLPFHGMSSYPYPESERPLVSDEWLDYQLKWNDRFDSGEPRHSFRFDYKFLPTTPADDHPRSGSGDRD